MLAAVIAFGVAELCFFALPSNLAEHPGQMMTSNVRLPVANLALPLATAMPRRVPRSAMPDALAFTAGVVGCVAALAVPRPAIQRKVGGRLQAPSMSAENAPGKRARNAYAEPSELLLISRPADSVPAAADPFAEFRVGDRVRISDAMDDERWRGLSGVVTEIWTPAQNEEGEMGPCCSELDMAPITVRLD